MQGLDPYISGFAPANDTATNSYFYGIGLLAWDGNVGYSTSSSIYNGPGATIKSVVAGSGVSLAMGIYSLQYYGNSGTPNIAIHNLGTVDGEVTNMTGRPPASTLQFVWRCESDQWCQRYLQWSRVILQFGITISSYYGAVNLENDGTARGFATGATLGWVAGLAYSAGIDLFTFDNNSNAPINIGNTGLASGLTIPAPSTPIFVTASFSGRKAAR